MGRKRAELSVRFCPPTRTFAVQLVNRRKGPKSARNGPDGKDSHSLTSSPVRFEPMAGVSPRQQSTLRNWERLREAPDVELHLLDGGC